jgi:hypothetical protein
MALSRLENFLKNAEGNILYVNPSDFDATDSIENQGNSLTRPFKTIQRALIEAAKFSYQSGRNNDKIDKTTILVYPGTHYIDNRPGFSIQPNPSSPNTALYKRRTGKDTWVTDTSLSEFTNSTNFDVLDSNNDLYKFNSVTGGVILPRGTSIIGLDLRKTKIRPLYVPDPNDPNIELSSIFNVTGTCYFTAFTILDADITKTVFKDYTSNRYVPNYSHHKLTVFTYADGVNKVALGLDQTNLTDLDMYYYKVAKVYSEISDYPINVDFEPTVDEFRIVGDLKQSPLGISSIVGSSSGIVTVTTANLQTRIEEAHNLFVDTPVLIGGVTVDTQSYNGSFIVNEVVGVTTFSFISPDPPAVFTLSEGDYDNAFVTVESDTVSSASPYVFNCSVRSVYGLCGMWADGSKASGFKSMVVAQYTGIGLQKDDNAFLLYDDDTSTFKTNDEVSEEDKPLHVNSKAIYKPDSESYHIRVSNNAFVQCVSIFAIGYAKQFLTETGGDMSITNSNSNFGAVALESFGFRNEAFIQDDTGFVTHIIPPKENEITNSEVSWLSLDTEKIISVGNSSRLYLFGYGTQDNMPSYQIDGYRIGAKENEVLNLNITQGSQLTTYSTKVLMPAPSGEVSAKKEFRVERFGTVNNIASNTLSLTQTHNFLNGEKVRIFSDTGETPKGIESDKIYYVITTGLASDEVRLANSLNDATSTPPNAITNIGTTGGVLTIVSNVSDKVPGDVGHPIQFDSAQSGWYVNCSQSNAIYNAVVGIGTSILGDQTSPLFVNRRFDSRSIEDRIYKLRYVIPKEYTTARAPQPGFILQESSSVKLSSASILTSDLSNPIQTRNDKLIVGAAATTETGKTNIVTITTELPHNFLIGDLVKVQNIRSTRNPIGTGLTSTFNGSYNILEVPNSRQFKYRISGITTSPGTFTNVISDRTTNQQRNNLPYVSREQYDNHYFIYRVNQIQEHIPGTNGRDGIYHIIVLASNVKLDSSVGYGLSTKEFNQDVRNLYPQVDRDNFNSDPDAAVSSADKKTIGRVLTNDKKKSITKETLDSFLKNNRVGFGITNVSLSGVGNTTITLFFDTEHNLNSIKRLTLTNGGAGYGSTTLYATSVVGGGGTGALIRATLSGGILNSTLTVVSGGSGYVQGQSINITPYPGVTPSTTATAAITEIVNNLNDGIELSGFNQSELNGVYQIVNIPSPTSVVIHHPQGIAGYSTNTNLDYPVAYNASKSAIVNSINFFDIRTGIVTVTTSTAHGLIKGNKFTIVGSGHTLYDTPYIVKDVVGLTTFTFNVGIVTETKQSTKGRILKHVFSANGGNLTNDETEIGSRGSYIYAGFTTSLISLSSSSPTATLTLPSSAGLNRGDYISINSEILRIASIAAGNAFTVLRGQFSTPKTTATSGTLVKKIKVIPLENRRPSFMRASGHTFEYVGYGPGNYSTGLPLKHDRTLTADEILTSQARETSGGTVVYTGMNDIGEFYSGSKKQNATTGEETIIEAPIITFTGDDAEGQASNRLSGIFDDVLVRERITIEGGANGNQTSQFYGPTNFTRRLTNTSDDGILVRNLNIKGLDVDKPKLIKVGLGTPTTQQTKGDITFVAEPTLEQPYVGNVYLGDGNWRRFGIVSQESNLLSFKIDKLLIGAQDNTFGFTDPLEVNGRATIKELEVINSLIVQGTITFQQPIFNNIFINQTATFAGTGITYTQVHNFGISKLNNLEVVGVSTFLKNVTFTEEVFGPEAKFGNIQVGKLTDNTITTVGDELTLSGFTKRVVVDSNLFVVGDVNINTPNGSVSIAHTTATVGIITTRLDKSHELKLGIGTAGAGGTGTTYTPKIELYDEDQVGFSIVRVSGAGVTGITTSTTITQFGNSNLVLGTKGNANVSIVTNDIERLNVSSGGTITYRQNNSTKTTNGAHLKLLQEGPGDVILSWFSNFANQKRRWYAGIDTSDYSWKLANPATILAEGGELFSNINETKLTINTSGDMTLLGSANLVNITASGDLAINGGDFTSSSTLFNLLNQSNRINFGTNAGIITVGAIGNQTIVRIQGSTASQSTTSGNLVVGGGVGIGGNITVGAGATILSTTESISKDTGALVVEGGVGIEKNLFVGGNISVGIAFSVAAATQSTDVNNGAFTVAGGAGIAKNLNIGENISVRGSAVFGVGPNNSTFTVVGISSFINNVTIDKSLEIRDNLTVDDNTRMRNLFVSGIATVNSGIVTNLTVTGITTFTEEVFIKSQSLKSIISGFSIVFGL